MKNLCLCPMFGMLQDLYDALSCPSLKAVAVLICLRSGRSRALRMRIPVGSFPGLVYLKSHKAALALFQ